MEDNDEEHSAETFETVVTDLAESIVPLNRGQEELPDAQNTATLNYPGPFPCICSNPCYAKFSPQDIEGFRLQYLSLEKNELDIALLAKIACGIHISSETIKSKKGAQSERKASRTDYAHHGHKICRSFFKYLHCIGQDKLNALIKHYKANGVESRTHKNS